MKDYTDKTLEAYKTLEEKIAYVKGIKTGLEMAVDIYKSDPITVEELKENRT